MNPRSLAVLAALVIVPAVTHAQEAVAPAASAPASAPTTRDLASDVDTVGGKVDAAAEKVAELDTAVAGLRKLKVSGYVQGRWGWLEGARYEPKCAAAVCTAGGTVSRSCSMRSRRGFSPRS